MNTSLIWRHILLLAREKLPKNKYRSTNTRKLLKKIFHQILSVFIYQEIDPDGRRIIGSFVAFFRAVSFFYIEVSKVFNRAVSKNHLSKDSPRGSGLQTVELSKLHYYPVVIAQILTMHDR